ncbi:MAG TPA: hypothetical protein VK828_13605 [Terriglobales bacterium]|nr:hypothetical protein [Terriglobales bacterium]
MREGYARDPSASHIMRLGVGYLWTEKYQAAWEHFQYAMQRDPFTTARFFGMAGAAKWCVEEPDAAVRFWESGLDSQFADGAGGVHLPLLLWVASILRPNVFSRSDANQLLERKVKDPRVKNWPGALAQFALHQIDEKTLEERSTQGNSRETAPSRDWLIAFYRRVLDLYRGDLNPKEFKGLMQRMTDTSAPRWSEERSLLSLLWNEEFFIARHEASIPSANLGLLLKS